MIALVRASMPSIIDSETSGWLIAFAGRGIHPHRRELHRYPRRRGVGAAHSADADEAEGASVVRRRVEPRGGDDTHLHRRTRRAVGAGSLDRCHRDHLDVSRGRRRRSRHDRFRDGKPPAAGVLGFPRLPPAPHRVGSRRLGSRQSRVGTGRLSRLRRRRTATATPQITIETAFRRWHETNLAAARDAGPLPATREGVPMVFVAAAEAGSKRRRSRRPPSTVCSPTCPRAGRTPDRGPWRKLFAASGASGGSVGIASVLAARASGEAAANESGWPTTSAATCCRRSWRGRPSSKFPTPS